MLLLGDALILPEEPLPVPGLGQALGQVLLELGGVGGGPDHLAELAGASAPVAGVLLDEGARDLVLVDGGGLLQAFAQAAGRVFPLGGAHLGDVGPFVKLLPVALIVVPGVFAAERLRLGVVLPDLSHDRVEHAPLPGFLQGPRVDPVQILVRHDVIALRDPVRGEFALFVDGGLLLADQRLQILEPAAGESDLLRAPAGAPQGQLQHFRGGTGDPVVHALRHDAHILQAVHLVAALLDLVEEAEGGVVVEALDADDLTLAVELIGQIGLVPVHVAADVVQHLQVHHILDEMPLADGVELIGVVDGLGELLGAGAQVLALGVVHEGALDHLAVLVHAAHGDGLGQQSGNAQQIGHGAHGGVAVVHTVSVPEPQIPDVDEVAGILHGGAEGKVQSLDGLRGELLRVETRLREDGLRHAHRILAVGKSVVQAEGQVGDGVFFAGGGIEAVISGTALIV